MSLECASNGWNYLQFSSWFGLSSNIWGSAWNLSKILSKSRTVDSPDPFPLSSVSIFVSLTRKLRSFVDNSHSWSLWLTVNIIVGGLTWIILFTLLYFTSCWFPWERFHGASIEVLAVSSDGQMKPTEMGKFSASCLNVHWLACAIRSCLDQFFSCYVLNLECWSAKVFRRPRLNTLILY